MEYSFFPEAGIESDEDLQALFFAFTGGNEAFLFCFGEEAGAGFVFGEEVYFGMEFIELAELGDALEGGEFAVYGAVGYVFVLAVCDVVVDDVDVFFYLVKGVFVQAVLFEPFEAVFVHGDGIDSEAGIGAFEFLFTVGPGDVFFLHVEKALFPDGCFLFAEGGFCFAPLRGNGLDVFFALELVRYVVIRKATHISAASGTFFLNWFTDIVLVLTFITLGNSKDCHICLLVW